MNPIFNTCWHYFCAMAAAHTRKRQSWYVVCVGQNGFILCSSDRYVRVVFGYRTGQLVVCTWLSRYSLPRFFGRSVCVSTNEHDKRCLCMFKVEDTPACITYLTIMDVQVLLSLQTHVSGVTGLSSFFFEPNIKSGGIILTKSHDRTKQN